MKITGIDSLPRDPSLICRRIARALPRRLNLSACIQLDADQVEHPDGNVIFRGRKPPGVAKLRLASVSESG